MDKMNKEYIQRAPSNLNETLGSGRFVDVTQGVERVVHYTYVSLRSLDPPVRMTKCPLKLNPKIVRDGYPGSL